MILYRERNPYNGLTTGWQELTENEFSFLKENAGENAEFLALSPRAASAGNTGFKNWLANWLLISSIAADWMKGEREVSGVGGENLPRRHARNRPQGIRFDVIADKSLSVACFIQTKC